MVESFGLVQGGAAPNEGAANGAWKTDQMNEWAAIPAVEAVPDTGVQIWTLAVAAFAALAAVFGAVLAAISASKRDRSSWLRQEQTLAYEAFAASAWAALDELASGAVDTALQDAHFAGLDDSVDAVLAHGGKLLDAVRKITVVGGSEVVLETWTYAVEWVQRSTLAVPMSATAHAPALEQRAFYIQHFGLKLLTLAALMRDDLGLLSRKEAKKLTQDRAEAMKLPALDMDSASAGEANAILRNWRVRTWERDAIGPDYRHDGTPWAMLNVRHAVLFQPLVAMLRKIPDVPWMLAIASEMTPAQIDLIERDAAMVVTTYGRRSHAKYGGRQWIAGELPGERLYWWTETDAPIDQ